jgi:MoaA/NifB/PqqE/SkfB family radical SAM enzyme
VAGGRARLVARFLRHRLRELHPFEVQAVLLNACNLRCAYCRFPELPTHPLGTAAWLAILRRLGELGCLRIKFQGGEPTLRKDFAELAAAARAAGIRTAVVSNGQRIAEAPELLDALDECVISVDALDPAVHDAQRGAGSHPRALRALELARARGLASYAVMVVTRDNRSQVEPLLAWCEARGIGFHAQPVDFGLHYTDPAARHLALSDGEMRELHASLARWSSAGRGVMFSPAAYERLLAWPDPAQRTERSRGPSRCMAGRFYAHIEANGEVWPCQQHGADWKPLNAASDGLDAALRHAQGHDCGDCWTAYLTERKLLFGLQPAALAAWVRRG